MAPHSPKERFDALASLLGFGPEQADLIKGSIVHLLPKVQELVRRFSESMSRDKLAPLLGEHEPEPLERLQSLMASFIMRTINCTFDEAFCDYAAEIAHDDVPEGYFALGLTLANDFVAQTLPHSMRNDPDALARSLAAWNRLTSVLRELTR